MDEELELKLKDLLATRGLEKTVLFGHMADENQKIADDELGVICKDAGLVMADKATDEDDPLTVIHKDRIIVFVASDSSQDRHGDVVDVDGWDTKNFKKNPVILRQHDAWSFLPVARGLKVWKGKGIDGAKDGKALMIAVHFPTKEVSEEGDNMFKLYKAKIMNMVSVGFKAIELVWPKDEAQRKSLGVGPNGVYFVKQELRELSLVAIGSNMNALQKGIESGDVRDALKAMSPETLSAMGVKVVKDEGTPAPAVVDPATQDVIKDAGLDADSLLAAIKSLEESNAKFTDELKNSLDALQKTILEKNAPDSTDLKPVETPSDKVNIRSVGEVLAAAIKEKGAPKETVGDILANAITKSTQSTGD